MAITVEPGMSTGEIGQLLEREGVITSASVFRYFVKINGLGTVEAGDYTLHQKEAMATVVDVLESGAKVDKGIPLTVPEGLTLPEVAELVGTLPGRSAEQFLQVAASGTVRPATSPRASPAWRDSSCPRPTSSSTTTTRPPSSGGW